MPASRDTRAHRSQLGDKHAAQLVAPSREERNKQNKKKERNDLEDRRSRFRSGDEGMERWIDGKGVDGK